MLADLLRRLLAAAETAEIRDGELVVNGRVVVNDLDRAALPSHVTDAARTQAAHHLHASILSLRRTAEHLRADGSLRWEPDAERLEKLAMAKEDELRDLIGEPGAR